MPRYLLKIKYMGTAYHGWQVQPNGITVQQILGDALKKITKQDIAVSGCSRTDAGVHANEFYCHFDTKDNFPKSAFVQGVNAILPDDISVLDANEIDSSFHARYNAKGKTYVYKFYDGEIRDPFLTKFTYFTAPKIDENKMNQFCKKIIGKHDFIGFSSSKRTVVDTVRTISECFAKREGDIVSLFITADGFLYNMVRIIAGTALDVAYGKIAVENIDSVINSRDRKMAGSTLPPHALFLERVIY